MGDLVVMSRAKPLPARALGAGHSAEILFFTGVRYYRMDEAAAPPVLAKLASGEAAAAKLAVPKRRRSPDQRSATKRARQQRLEALA